ncbi:hypothetical protein ACWD62_16295 [Streptomyces sp. NPDC005146]
MPVEDRVASTWEPLITTADSFPPLATPIPRRSCCPARSVFLQLPTEKLALAHRGVAILRRHRDRQGSPGRWIRRANRGPSREVEEVPSVRSRHRLGTEARVAAASAAVVGMPLRVSAGYARPRTSRCSRCRPLPHRPNPSCCVAPSPTSNPWVP